LEQKKQDLKYFMTRRIAHLIEEQENRSKIFNTRGLDVEVARKLEDSQKIEVPTPDKEEVLPPNPRKESQQRAVRRGIRLKSYRKFQREIHKREICKIGTSSGYQNSDKWNFIMEK
jgi:hypothetical protein